MVRELFAPQIVQSFLQKVYPEMAEAKPHLHREGTMQVTAKVNIPSWLLKDVILIGNERLHACLFLLC